VYLLITLFCSFLSINTRHIILLCFVYRHVFGSIQQYICCLIHSNRNLEKLILIAKKAKEMEESTLLKEELTKMVESEEKGNNWESLTTEVKPFPSESAEMIETAKIRQDCKFDPSLSGVPITADISGEEIAAFRKAQTLNNRFLLSLKNLLFNLRNDTKQHTKHKNIHTLKKTRSLLQFPYLCE